MDGNAVEAEVHVTPGGTKVRIVGPGRALYDILSRDPVARTPIINRLARDGILLEVAFGRSPTCLPPASSRLTGTVGAECGLLSSV